VVLADFSSLNDGHAQSSTLFPVELQFTNDVTSTRLVSFFKEIPPVIYGIKEEDWSLLTLCVLTTKDLSLWLSKTRSTRNSFESSRDLSSSQGTTATVIWHEIFVGINFSGVCDPQKTNKFWHAMRAEAMTLSRHHFKLSQTIDNCKNILH